MQSGPSCSGDVSALPGLEDFWARLPVAYAHRQGLWRPSGPESQRRGTFCRRFAASRRCVDCTILGLSLEAICCRCFAAENRKLSSCGGLYALIRVIRGSLFAEHFQGDKLRQYGPTRTQCNGTRTRKDRDDASRLSIVNDSTSFQGSNRVGVRVPRC